MAGKAARWCVARLGLQLASSLPRADGWCFRWLKGSFGYPQREIAGAGLPGWNRVVQLSRGFPVHSAGNPSWCLLFYSRGPDPFQETFSISRLWQKPCCCKYSIENPHGPTGYNWPKLKAGQASGQSHVGGAIRLPHSFLRASVGSGEYAEGCTVSQRQGQDQLL